MADPTPHWPGGAPADPPPEGHRYMLDGDGLVIGIVSDPVFVAPEDFPAFCERLGIEVPFRFNEAQRALCRALTDPAPCWDCGKTRDLPHLKYVKSRRQFGFYRVCAECYKPSDGSGASLDAPPDSPRSE